MIVMYINRIQIPRLIPEVIHNVHGMQHIHQPHGVCHMSIGVLLIKGERHVDDGPRHDPGSAVEEQLEIEPFPYARIELDTHHEVVEDVAGEFAIFFARREIVCFDEDKYGDGVAENVCDPKHLAPVVKHDRGREPFEVKAIGKEQT